MNHGSLFSGIGGFDLAAQWMGWENKFHCEWNEFGRKILKYYWSKAKSYEDITKTDFTIWGGQIDILTGGFPCQPYSVAGKRLGKEDDRHLWPEMLRAIREIQPRWVVGENVSGLINWNGGLVFEEVQADLEAQGYEVQPYVLPAASVNAPHRRDRIWFVAYANERTTGPSRTSGKTKSDWRKNNDEQSCGRKQTEQHIRFSNVLRADTNSEGQQGERGQSEQREFSKSQQREFRGNSSEMGNRNASNSDSIIGCKGRVYEKGQEKAERYACSCNTRANWENWQNFPTQSPVCNGNDGISSQLDGITFPKWRNESIKAGGNAVVPQVVLQIFKAIQQYENLLI